MPDLSLHSSQTLKVTGTDDKPVDGAYKKLIKILTFSGIRMFQM
jgi:hypothetical protein